MNDAGAGGTVKRCDLAYTNEHRDWRPFEDETGVLMSWMRRLCADGLTPLALDTGLFALDAVAGHVTALKLKVLLDLRPDFSAFASLQEGHRHEMASRDEHQAIPRRYYVMDYGPLDLLRLH